MLQPKRTKFRKMQKGRVRGLAYRGSQIAYGSFAIKTMEVGFITSRQIEAARIAINRYMKRQGQVWIRIFPDKPITSKPAEVRMGKGKGAPSHWVAPVRPGRIMFGSGRCVSRDCSRSTSPRSSEASGKMQVCCTPRLRCIMIEMNEIRQMSDKDLSERLVVEREALSKLRFNHSVAGLESPNILKNKKRDIARLLTEQNLRKNTNGTNA